MTLKSLSFSLLVVSIEDEDLSSLSEELHKKREMAPDFFKSAPIVIQVNNENSAIDFGKIKQVVIDQNFILAGVSGELSNEQKTALHTLHIGVLRSSMHATKRKVLTDRRTLIADRRKVVIEETVNVDDPTETEIIEDPIVGNIDPKAQLYTGRVRSGQQIYAKENDLIINGDVNAGAEVIADGNIYIYGVLRGKAIAGAMGDQKASVYCTSLSPELVSIAGVYKLTEGLPTEFINKSCTVSLKDEQLTVTSLYQI